MKNLLKKLTCVLVIACMSLSMFMLAACNNNNNDDDKNPDDKKPLTIDSIQFEDRSNYTATNLENNYMEASVYDVMNPAENGNQTVKGFLVGDVYNMLVEELTAMAGSAGAPGVVAPYEQAGAEQMNFEVFGFKRDSQGNWRNYFKADVHPIMNKLLNYKLDGSTKLTITENELKTYGDVKLSAILKDSLSNTKVTLNGTLIQENNESAKNYEQLFNAILVSLQDVPMLSETLNASLADFTKLLDGTLEEQNLAFTKLYGSLKVGDLTAVLGVALPVEVSEMPLTAIKAAIDQVNQAGGVNAYFEQVVMPQITQMTEAVMAMTFGDVMANFGVTDLPANLANYTVAQILAEFMPSAEPAPAPAAETTDGTTTDTTTEEPTTSFYQELRAYLCGLNIPMANSTLKGEELVNCFEQLFGILTATRTGTNLEQFDAMIKDLNAFVTENDARMTEVIKELDNTTLRFTVDGVNELLPSEFFALIKDFISQGETYQSYMTMLKQTTVEALMTANGTALPVTGVEKVDTFVNKYKAYTLADFINNVDTFMQEYMAMENSLTLEEAMVLSGYGYLLETNNAVKTFMATYGNKTEAELSALSTDPEYLKAVVELYKGLKVKELMPLTMPM